VYLLDPLVYLPKVGLVPSDPLLKRVHALPTRAATRAVTLHLQGSSRSAQPPENTQAAVDSRENPSSVSVFGMCTFRDRSKAEADPRCRSLGRLLQAEKPDRPFVVDDGQMVNAVLRH
jgi:hypothetical protein